MAITYDARTGTLTSTGSYSVDVTTGNVTLNTANNIDFEDGGTLIGRWREEDFSVYSNKSTHSASDLADRVDNTWAAGNYTSTFVGGPTWTISGTAGITISDPVTFNTSGTTETSINIPHGAAPSTPTNGDIWTTTAGMFIYVNGSTVGPLSDSTGTGNVSNTGTPLDNQIAVFTNGTTIEGDANFTWNGTTLAVTGAVTVDTITLDSTDITASGSLFLQVDGGDSGIDINANNTISLYTNNVRRFRTDTNGVNITGDLNADTDVNLIYWEWANFTDRAQVGFSGNGNFTIDNLVDSGHVNIRAKNSSSATVSILNADPDAGTAIYGTGVEAKRIYGGTVQTTNATQTEVLATDAIGTDQFMGFEVYVIGTETATGDSVYERVFGAIINDAGTTSLVGSNITERADDAGASTWTITVAADDTADTLTVDVTGEAAHTIDWKCRVELMEV
jgi:hypothetical protein